MTAEAEILFEKRGQIGLVTLNRPKALNALTLEMIREFQPVLEAWATDDAVRAVVVQGSGEKAFCAGGDVLAVYRAGLPCRKPPSGFSLTWGGPTSCRACPARLGFIWP